MSKTLSPQVIVNIKRCLHVLLIGYILFHVFLLFTGQLSADPIEELIGKSGEMAIRLLVVILIITPLRKITNWTSLVKFRRLLGVYMFIYTAMHAQLYIGLQQGFDLAIILEDFLDRRFLTVGIITLLLLIPLAITSTNGWVKKLGAKWKKLHKLIYIIAPLAVLHFYWQERTGRDIEPFIYGIIFAVLLLLRVKPISKYLSRSPKKQ